MTEDAAATADGFAGMKGSEVDLDAVVDGVLLPALRGLLEPIARQRSVAGDVFVAAADSFMAEERALEVAIAVVLRGEGMGMQGVTRGEGREEVVRESLGCWETGAGDLEEAEEGCVGAGVVSASGSSC